MSGVSAARALEASLSQKTPKEQFEALAGSQQLWWQYCQDAMRLEPEWEAASHRAAELADNQASSADHSRAFVASANAVAAVARILTQPAGEGCDGPRLWDALRPLVQYWADTGLLVPMPPGSGLLPPEGLTAVDVRFHGQVRAIVRTLDGHAGGAARAMAILTALRLTGVHPRRRRVSRIPVLFDRATTTTGASGVLEVYEFPGGPAGLFPDPQVMGFIRADDEFTTALTRAWEYASRGRAASRCVLWRLMLHDRTPVSSLAGGSLGAPLAVALHDLLRNQVTYTRPWSQVLAAFRSLRPRCAVSGAIAEDETLDRVGGMHAKLEAARTSGWRLVAPERNRSDQVQVSGEVHIYWASTLRQADHYARRWRPVRTSLAGAATLVLAVTAAVIILEQQDVSSAQDLAASGQLIRESEALGDSNPTVSQLEAVAAWRLDPSAAARYAMLQAAALPGITTLSPAGSGVTSAAFSPDSKVIATGDANGMTQLWSVATHRRIGSLPGNAGSVQAVAFSPDGKLLATAETKGVTQVWDVSTHRRLTRLIVRDSSQLRRLNSTAISSVAFSTDGTLATGSFDGSARLWNVTTGRQIGKPLKAAPLMLPAYIASGGDALHSLEPERGPNPVDSIAFSPDGKVLAAGNNDGTIRLWNVATHQQIGGPFGRSSLPIESVAFSPSGKIVAEAANPLHGNSGGVRLWNVATHRMIGKTIISQHRMVQSIAFSPDGSTLVAGDEDGTTQLWDTATHDQIGEPLTDGAGAVSLVTFSPNGKMLATVSSDGTARLWSTAIARWTGSSLAWPPDGPDDWTGSLAFSPDGKVLAVGNSGSVRLWNAVTHREIGSLPGGAGGRGIVTIGPDGKIIAAATSDGEVRLWNVATRTPVEAALGIPAGGANSIAFSPNGKVLAVATGNDEGVVRLWDVATGRQVGSPIGQKIRGVLSAAFSPNGKLLATGNADGTTQLWNVATHQAVGRPLAGGTGSIQSLAFSPDGGILATGDNHGIARLWDVNTREQIGEPLTAGDSEIDSVAFSPHNRTLVTGSYDGTARLWDVPTQRQIGRPLTAGTSGAVLVAFSPDGKTVASAETLASPGEFVQLWNVRYLSENLPQSLCALADRSLTRAEWERYVPPGPAYQATCP
jgi:WD40 repeat protein